MYCTPTAPQSQEAGLALDGGDYVCWRRKLDYAAPQLLACVAPGCLAAGQPRRPRIA